MKQQRDSFWVWGAGLAGVILIAAAAIYVWQRDGGPVPIDETPAPAPAPVVNEAPRAPPPPAAEAAPERPPLPPLDESDSEVTAGLEQVVGVDAVKNYLVPERIVRNLAVTIDNATREKMALQQRPIKGPKGQFVVGGTEDAPVISPENYKRYEPVVALVKGLDAQTAVAWYRGLQPLFQTAYEDLGHPNDFFNTRLLEVIDHLLATPDVKGPVKLVRPSVYYKFADPKLESLSSGQKLLIRMGPENAAIIKAKLREIQQALS